LTDEFTMKWRVAQKFPLHLLELTLNPECRLLKRHQRFNKGSPDVAGSEVNLHCLGPDSQRGRKHTMRKGKNGRIEDPVLDFKRDGRISHPFETPIRDKDEIL